MLNEIVPTDPLIPYFAINLFTYRLSKQIRFNGLNSALKYKITQSKKAAESNSAAFSDITEQFWILEDLNASDISIRL
ncbi:hypothetical protein C9J40_01680 [Photobacterium sp. GB-72]|nr:hypothetical protein C9J40_01680 [Photobacterium sp. GB-72]